MISAYILALLRPKFSEPCSVLLWEAGSWGKFGGKFDLALICSDPNMATRFLILIIELVIWNLSGPNRTDDPGEDGMHFWYLLNSLNLPSSAKPIHWQYWTSNVFTELWPGCPPEYPSRHLGSPDLGAPGPGHAPGRCRSLTRQFGGQHSVLFP